MTSCIPYACFHIFQSYCHRSLYVYIPSIPKSDRVVNPKFLKISTNFWVPFSTYDSLRKRTNQLQVLLVIFSTKIKSAYFHNLYHIYLCFKLEESTNPKYSKIWQECVYLYNHALVTCQLYLRLTWLTNKLF